MTIQCPIPKILLPVDGSQNAKRAVEFTGCLGRLMGKSLSVVTLLYVMPGSYLGKHSDYKDFRSEIVKQSDTIKKIRAQHIEKDIKPFLDASEKILKDEGIEINIEELVVDGDPSGEIVRIADKGNYSTIMMGRKEHADPKNFLTGVTNKVVRAASKHTVYVVGLDVLKGQACPIPKILVPVDGSKYSVKGVEHAACLASTFSSSISMITLLRVINVDRSEKAEDLEKEAQQILDEAKKIFLHAGVSEDRITTKFQSGKPADEIIKEVEGENYNLIILGRKGRSAIKELILGGVSTKVLQRCPNQTIAIVSSK
jgi:nucleotide-binding universal stress UspA family protein